MMELLDFSDEVIVLILKYLNQVELAHAALVSKKMKELARTSILWKRMKIYAYPMTNFHLKRSTESLGSMIDGFVNIKTIDIILKHSWTGNNHGDDLTEGLKFILDKKSSVQAIELHLSNQGLTECKSIYEILEDHGSNIDSIKILEKGPGTFWRWEDWTKEFMNVAPMFWSHLKTVELKDGGVRPLIVEDGALVKIIQNSPHLQTLVINSGSMLKAEEIHNMLDMMEEHKEIRVFKYKTIWDIWGSESPKGMKCFDSKSFNAGIEYIETETTMLIYAHRK